MPQARWFMPYSNPKLVMKRSRAFRRPYPAKA